MSSLLNLEFIESSLMARTPGMIVGPIAEILGYVYNILFNFIYGFAQSGSLGIAIILFTLFIKVILTPLIYKQQQSSYKMQKLQPELAKIRAKYSAKKDQESQQRMALEMQKFQKDNGINLLGGCLPLLVQLPILYALFYIFQQAYVYVDVVNMNYGQIADILLQIPAQLRVDALSEVIISKNMEIDVAIKDELVMMINQLGISDWEQILQNLPSYKEKLEPLLLEKNSFEYFLGINVVDTAGFGFPGIIVPLLAGGSTWLSSKLMAQSQSTDPNDPAAATMKTMNTIMPIMMGVMTISMPVGLGLYWTASNIITMLQTMLLKKYFAFKDLKQTGGEI